MERLTEIIEAGHAFGVVDHASISYAVNGQINSRAIQAGLRKFAADRGIFCVEGYEVKTVDGQPFDTENTTHRDILSRIEQDVIGMGRDGVGMEVISNLPGYGAGKPILVRVGDAQTYDIPLSDAAIYFSDRNGFTYMNDAGMNYAM